MMIIMINNYLINNSLLEYVLIVTLRPFVLESYYREGERRWREGGRVGEKREGGRERGKGEGGGRGERCAFVNLLSLSLPYLKSDHSCSITENFNLCRTIKLHNTCRYMCMCTHIMSVHNKLLIIIIKTLAKLHTCITSALTFQLK